ncbi:hypothetical protein [Pseudochryseolinea flava]|nr:hypothetical protein [Pseudochryseolinea flava]
MKKVILFACLVVLFSCKDDDSGPGYDFEDQDAMGEIDGKEWRYQDGYADVSNNEVRVTLMVAQDGESGCDVFLAEGDQVFFTVPAEKGIYKLSLGADSRTVTLLSDEEIPDNHIASEGAVEIVSISSTDVKGKIDARSSDDSFVNGDFRVLICK